MAARFAVLDFGEVTLATRPGELDRAFARREMDEDEPGSLLLASAVAERRARGRGAERRLPLVAGAAGARGRARRADPGAAVAATPWQVPSPREAGQLAEAFTGAPVGLVWDPGGCRCWRPWVWRSPTSGCGPWPARRCWRSITTRSASRRASSPASASATPASRALAPGASAPHIVTGGPVASDAEVAAAVRLARGE